MSDWPAQPQSNDCDLHHVGTLLDRLEMWGQRQIDTRALEVAAAVASRQDHHEDECTRRYGALDATLQRFHDKIDENARERLADSQRIYGLLWKFAIAALGMLVVIIGYLLAHGVPWQMALTK